MTEEIAFSLFNGRVEVPFYFTQVLLAGLLGVLIGLERAFRKKTASLKTFAFISMGSCLFTMLSLGAGGVESAESYDITRIAAQIVSGIGFVGGGVIFKTANRVEGITTAAMIWLTAAFGMAVGFNQVGLALWAFAAYVVIYWLTFILYVILRVPGKKQEPLLDDD